MIREKRKLDQWQKTSNIDLGPGQYNPYASKDGGKYSFCEKYDCLKANRFLGRKLTILNRLCPSKHWEIYPECRKRTDIPFGSGQDRFKKFLPLNVMPGPGQYYHQRANTVEDLSNKAAVSFKSQSPRLQMYYELERKLSKSSMSYDKQEILA